MTDQNTPPPLHAWLRRMSRRRRWQAGVAASLPLVGGGLALTLALLLAGWLYPLGRPLGLLLAGLGLTVAGLLLGWAYLWLRPRPPQALARELDRRLGLEERLATALELAAGAGSIPPAIVQAQLQDTLNRLHGLNPAQIYPIRLPWRWLGLANGLALAIFLSLLLPNPYLAGLQQQARTREVMAKQKDLLQEIRADLIENEALLETPAGQNTVQTLDELIESLEKEQLTAEEAMADLAEAEQQLATLENALAGQEATLNDLAETINQFESGADLAEAIEQRDHSRAAEFLQAAAESPPTEAESAQQLADTLQQMAQTAEANGNDELAESLQQAAEALQQAAAGGITPQNSEALQETLQQAAEALAQAEQQLDSQEALEQALGNIQEAREQLAEAGQGDGQGQAQQQAQAGQGQGQGQQPGGWGQGLPGNEGAGAGQGDPGPGAPDLYADKPIPEELDTDNGPGPGRQAEYNPQFPPIHWGGEDGPLVNPEQQGAEGGLPIGEAPVDPNQESNPAQVPYNQVYRQYADAAGEALDDSYIPLGMKEFVRNYFGALEPGEE